MTQLQGDECKVIPVDGDPVAAFAYELERVAASVQAGRADEFLSGEAARDALILCRREIESVLTGRAVGV